MRDDPETPKGWAVVPGTTEKAPIIEIVVFVAAMFGLLAFCGMALGTGILALAAMIGAL